MKNWSLKKKVVVGLLALVVFLLVVGFRFYGDFLDARLKGEVVKTEEDSKRGLLYEKQKQVVVPTVMDIDENEKIDSGKQEDVVPEEVLVEIEPNL